MGRFSGLAEAMSVVADKLKADREMEMKQNLLGYEGLIKGTIAPAQEGEKGFSVPGMGRVKSVSETPSTWDIQKEARTTVNAMVNQNPVLQAQAFQNPSMLTDLIDTEVVRLSNKYKGGKTSTTEPTTKLPTKIEPTNEKILVINPDGQKGYIPKSQLQEALNSGYKRSIK